MAVTEAYFAFGVPYSGSGVPGAETFTEDHESSVSEASFCGIVLPANRRLICLCEAESKPGSRPKGYS